jgi:hypothetical protein
MTAILLNLLVVVEAAATVLHMSFQDTSTLSSIVL